MKSKKANIFNLNTIIIVIEFFYKKEKSQTLFKKNKKIEKKLKAHIKKQHFNLKDILKKKAPQAENLNIEKIKLISKKDQPKISTKILFLPKNNINSLTHIFRKLILII